MYECDQYGNPKDTPYFGPVSTRTGREVVLNNFEFDLNNVNSNADLRKAVLRYMFVIENPSEDKDLGVYFTNNVVTDKANVGSSVEECDIKTEIPLTATLMSDSSKTNTDLVKAVFERGYSKLNKKTGDKNGSCRVFMEFELKEIPSSDFEVKLNKNKNPIYLNIEEYQEVPSGQPALNDQAFALMEYEVLSPNADGMFTIPEGTTKVKIAEGTTLIGESAFEECESLISVIIPDTVTIIDECAFACCTGLTKITIPDSVTSIGGAAFAECEGLLSVYFGNGLTSFSKETFSSCYSLLAIKIDSNIREWDDSSFTYSYSLESIVVDSANPVYNDGDGSNAIIDENDVLLMGCKTTIIPNTVTSIGEYAFLDCEGLTSISIPSSVTSIGEAAFEGSGLTSVVLPDSVESIAKRAFNNCGNLTSVRISSSVTSIAEKAFSACSNLVNISVDEGNTVYNDGNGSNVIIANNVLVVGCKNSVIPTTVTAIGEYAFYECTGLTSITLENNITAIYEGAFMSCENLTSVTMPADGWWMTRSLGGTKEREITDDLSDPTVAAELLTDRSAGYYWYRT